MIKPNTTAIRYLRPLNGKRLTHLVLCSDGDTYSVPASSAPASELITFLGEQLMRRVGVETPVLVPIAIDEEIAKSMVANQEHTAAPVYPYVALASRYPVDPQKVSIYDFLPEGMMERVENLQDFWKMLPIDLLYQNPRPRASMFYGSGKGTPRTFTASMIGLTEFRSVEAGRETLGGVLAVFPQYYQGLFNLDAVYGVVDAIMRLRQNDLTELLEACPTLIPSAEAYANIRTIIATFFLNRELLAKRIDNLLTELEIRLSTARIARKPPGIHTLRVGSLNTISLLA